MKFRTKPSEIEAFQLTAETLKDREAWPGWMMDAWQRDPGSDQSIALGASGYWLSRSYEHPAQMTVGAWVVRKLVPNRDDKSGGPKGAPEHELFVLSRSEFLKQYEPAGLTSEMLISKAEEFSGAVREKGSGRSA